MNYEGINREERPNFYQHSSEISGQKVHSRRVGKEVVLRIRLWISYISLALVMGATFIYAYTGVALNGGVNMPGEPQVIDDVRNLAIVYLIVIGVNVAINIFIAKRYRR